MNWFILFYLLYLSTGTLIAKDYWKHSELQGDVGSCHTFATIALVEAEYWRASGQFINLSERDLFLRHYTNGHSSCSEMITHQLVAATYKMLPQRYGEAGHINLDFSLAQKNGIASERELPYDPLFSNGVAMAMKRLRFERDQLAKEASQLKNTKQWSSSVAQTKIQQSFYQLKSVQKTLSLPEYTRTRDWTQKWLENYKLRHLKPKTTSQVKSSIIAQLSASPVAVDVSNFEELISHSHHTSCNYSRHSLVVSHYNPGTDQFSIRSSTHKDSIWVSANALSRGTYQLYYVERNNSSDSPSTLTVAN
ncbi:MAG: C1 family peptidase [Rubritalea sp.]|uniref:C1 family peptidase n=1 Tax=Rubritalea sp. TaxID=2109375 RepID=UPI003241BB5D